MRSHGSRKTARSPLRAFSLILCHWALAEAASARTLLPPPGAPADSTVAEAVLYLDLTINGMPAQDVIRVVQRGAELRIRASDLAAAGVVAPIADEWITLGNAADLQFRYDVNALRLEIVVPSHWLAAQHFEARTAQAMPATSDAGMLLNYAANIIDSSGIGAAASLWTELRAFNSGGVFSHTGIARRVIDSEIDRNFRQRDYVRFDTSWSYADENALHSWTIGDLVTPAQSWSSPVRLAGLKLSRDFRLRPDLITYPLPQFAGETAVPTTLDLFINGRRVRSEELRPGPYTISTIPFVTGAGEATLVTTDVTGRQVTTTLPFYASSELLRRGLIDYAASFGSLRQDYGLENFAYGGLASTGSIRYGLTNSFTLEGQAELANASSGTYGLIGAGAISTLGTRGIVNASVSTSTSAEGDGQQYTFGYRYAVGGMNFGYQGARVSKYFRSLATVDKQGSTVSGANSDVVTAGVSWGPFGSTSVSYLRVAPRGHDESRFVNLSYSRHLASALSLSLFASHDLERDETTAMAQVMASFGHRGNVRVGTQQGDGARKSIQYARPTPSYGGFGWNLGLVRDETDRTSGDANLAWSTDYARAEAGFTSSAHADVRWFDLRGSLLAMGGGLFAARQINDAFVVVETEGQSDLPVRYENQLIGRTNRSGRLLIPSVTSHYAGRLSVDALGLPPEVVVNDVDQRVVVKRNSGVVLKFDVSRRRPALLKLVDMQGAAIPVGSIAFDTRTDQSGTVGYDGLAYFEDLETEIALEVRMNDGGICRVAAALPESINAFEPIGPLTCEQSP
jgi:outer membrane usher protein